MILNSENDLKEQAECFTSTHRPINLMRANEENDDFTFLEVLLRRSYDKSLGNEPGLGIDVQSL